MCICKKILLRSEQFHLTQSAVVILWTERYIFAKPVRRSEMFSGHCICKFNFCNLESGELAGKNIQFDGKRVGERNHIASFFDADAVNLCLKMFVAFSGQRKIVFFSDHHAAGFVGEFIAVVILSDTHDGVCAEIALFNRAKRKRRQIERDCVDQI